MNWRKIRSGGFLVGLMLAFLTLAACSVNPVRSGLTEAEQAALTPQQQLFVAEADYLINKADFAAYVEQPRCAPPNLIVACHDPKVVKELRALDFQVREAFRVARVATGDDQAVKADVARALLARFAARIAAVTLTGG